MNEECPALSLFALVVSIVALVVAIVVSLATSCGPAHPTRDGNGSWLLVVCQTDGGDCRWETFEVDGGWVPTAAGMGRGP